MDEKVFVKAQIQRKFLDMHPGKKMFPQRNLHYRTSLGPIRHKLQNTQEPQINEKNLFQEIDRLRHIITLRSNEIDQLKGQIRLSKAPSPNFRGIRRQHMGNNSMNYTLKRPSTFLLLENPKSLSPGNLRGSEGRHDASFVIRNTPQKPLEKLHKSMDRIWRQPVYLTKKSPKALADDPITGLPRASLLQSFYNLN